VLVPRNRLLLWVAVIVLPFSVLGVVEPGMAAVSAAAIGALVLLALADAVGARRSLAGISLALPGIARMSKDRESQLEVRIRNELQRPKTLRLALGLPQEFASPYEDAFVALPKDSEWSRFAWTCVPRRRGAYRLEAAYLEAASPLGFWALRKTVGVHSELRVYPNLHHERRDLAALFLHRGAFGLHAQRQVGQGRDFEKLREYIPGDSFEEVHWKATAKRGRPITKVFQIERTQEVYVVIDASRLSARGAEEGARVEEGGLKMEAGRSASAAPSSILYSPSSTTLERYLAAALVLGLAAEQQGDLFGVLAFSNKVDAFVRAKNGKTHYSACRDALYAVHPQIVTPDYEELFTFIRLRLRHRALLVVLTALDDSVLAQSFVKNVDLVRRQHLVLVNMLPPPGVAPVFSDARAGSVDDVYRHLGGHLLWQKLRELEKVLQRRGVHFSLLKNERLSAQLVSQYLNVKQRQLL
jgi:uncharacterized protein (DUF58 family)